MDDARKQKSSLASWIAALALGGLIVHFVHRGPIAGRGEKLASVDDVKAYIQTRYYREIDDRALDYGAMKGLVSALDPFSAFFTPEEAKTFTDVTKGAFEGLGIEITIDQGLVTVIAPIEGTPAFRAGILPGDKILYIDDKPYEFASTEEAARALKGPAGTKITLTVLHKDPSGEETITIERARIHAPSVKRPRFADEEAGIAYVRIAQFQPETREELERVLGELGKRRELRGLVLDVRSNPGGLLEAAVGSADLFLEEGVIVRSVGRSSGDTRTYEARRDGSSLEAVPIAVLVNEGSASASEILAGALKDLGRATIVGSRTFGKGSVQSLVDDFEDGSILKLTTARFFTASGRTIHREEGQGEEGEWGVRPDVDVALATAELVRILLSIDLHGTSERKDTQLEAAVEALRKRVAGAGSGTGTGTGTGPSASTGE